ncbi:MAG TPA: PqqD family protein, partial [Gemmatimonadales bacterium]|nr:PqqD family protein [Gemmatimonadales bacterium]
MTDQRTWAREVVKASVVPAARVTDLIVSKTSNDLLVYDQRTHHIHHLNEAAAAIWRMCDGQRS